MAIGVIGGALAVVCYLFVGIAMHRKPDNVTRFLDYSVLVPRAVPGLLAGLAFLWVFLFLPMWLDQSLKNGWLSAPPVADWLREHLIVRRARCETPFLASGWPIPSYGWLTGCGLSPRRCYRWPELEEAARSTGIARADHPPRHGSAVALRLNRLLAADVSYLRARIFHRGLSFSGTETIGSMLVSLVGGGGYRYRCRALLY